MEKKVEKLLVANKYEEALKEAKYRKKYAILRGCTL